MIPSIDPKPPGRKLIKRMSTRTKWMILAPCGLLMFSFGLTVLSEAAHQRRTGVPTQVWVVLGLYSLVLINTGLILFGEALRFRILLNVRRETRRSMRQILRKVNTKSSRKTKSDKKAKSPTKTD
jgi:multidrug transporter EmrE-like cation transporter